MPGILQELKDTFVKLAAAITAGGHWIRVLNKRSVSSSGNFFSYMVCDSQISLIQCVDTVCHEL